MRTTFSLLAGLLVLGIAGTIGTSNGAAVAAAGNIEGQIKDRSGSPLPGVFVTAIPEGGGPTRESMTDRGGAYRFDGLPDDTYRLDFNLPGFHLERHNRVRVRADALIKIDGVLSVGNLCECVDVDLSNLPRPVAGQVVDEANRPLPHARLDIVGPTRRESAYADREGRFLVRVTTEGPWRLTVSESGFETVTREILSLRAQPVVLTLRHVGGQDPADTEQLRRGCWCPANLFVHELTLDRR